MTHLCFVRLPFIENVSSISFTKFPYRFSNAIQNTWRFIFQEWFPRNNLEHAGTYEIEIYDERCSDKYGDGYLYSD
ncbi:GyrI-like domain-containing protein [Paenibacillus sedimenti]|uniref:GyrI-like domain-containing protein n=1 Tax=Paenibacillus sedimenti TaxID=2770274 RepID=A0A926KV91_9BACL|nr:GyrI-like domain-containing protein [Paenibacillus sedimenti]MBD0384799.1 GyrI-like domain-containing protein [Paenibacillus sedimenti]